MKHWMFRCNDVSRKVSQSLDASLPFLHRLAIRMHLLMCRYCARFRRQLVMLRNASRHMDDAPSTDEATATLSDETKERIKKALRAAP